MVLKTSMSISPRSTKEMPDKILVPFKTDWKLYT